MLRFIVCPKYSSAMVSFTHTEERWNTWSHAFGIVLGVGAGAVLLHFCSKSGTLWSYIGVFLYLFGMLSSYISSTFYHAAALGSFRKQTLRKFDHAAIYWHIAGSYSPILLVAMRGEALWGWGLFGFIWLCALVGTFMSFKHLRDHSNLETICFVLMGLSILVAFKPLLHCVSKEVVLWIIAEGVFYLVGALFYSFKGKRYMHCVFHFFVLAGTLCHLCAVMLMFVEQAC